MWFGSSRLLAFGAAEARARRDRTCAAEHSEDHRGDQPDDFDASITPLPAGHREEPDNRPRP